MKKVQLKQYGVPEKVARCAQVDDLDAPGPGEVVFDVLAFPINPADISFCQGNYRVRPPLPATPGAECVGRITDVGDGVTHLRPGDLVINLERENWAQKRKVSAQSAIKIPSDLELHQAAMLRINPATVFLMLKDIVALQPGDWIVQNAANSAVGHLTVSLAKARGLKTLNIVRRADVIDELEGLGADCCLIDGPDLGERASEAVNGADIRLGLDAVAGEGTQRIANCLTDEGTVCTYGAMSGEAPHLGIADIVFRGITLTGFMLGRFMARRSYEEITALYADLAAEIRQGHLHAPVEQVFPIEEISLAVARARSAGRSGKILVAPNGLI